jgi:hypothetical protein
MQIELNSSNELTVIGNIKSIEDSMQIKVALNKLQEKGVKSIILKIQDSFSMTSTVIGHLMKLVNLNRITVSLMVGDQRLYDLLEELSLVQHFNVRLARK